MLVNLFLCTKEKPNMWTSRLGTWLSEWRTQVQNPSPHIKSRVQLVSVIQSALAKSQLNSVGNFISDKARSDRKKLVSDLHICVHKHTHTFLQSYNLKCLFSLLLLMLLTRQNVSRSMTNSKQIFIEKASVFVNTTQMSQLRRNSTQKALVSLTGCGYV